MCNEHEYSHVKCGAPPQRGSRNIFGVGDRLKDNARSVVDCTGFEPCYRSTMREVSECTATQTLGALLEGVPEIIF